MNKKLLEYFKGNELAANVWQSKYAAEGEESPEDMHKRMAKEFGRIEDKYVKQEKDIDWSNLSEYGKDRERLTYDRIYNLFKDFKYIIPQGSVMSQLGVESIGSLSNCFVIGQPEDSYGGIMMKDEEMVQLMKRRGGVGIDISTLRPEGTVTTNAAKSSTGAVSFMHRFSNTTREVAQNGRRGALMISMDINHPDIMEFIKIKRDLSQVTGANISIKINDEFMKAVENDEDYILRFPVDADITGKEKDMLELPYNQLSSYGIYGIEKKTLYFKKIKAKEYWDEIIKSAHGVAEPGLMFWDNMVGYSPDGAYEQFRQVTTNPCSEIAMQPYDACRLIAVNLFSFVKDPFTSKAEFDFERFYQINYEAMRLSDDLIDLEIEHIDRILHKLNMDPEDIEVKYREIRLWNKVRETAMASRRTGLGFTALGDTLAALGLKYDSDESLEIIEQIMKTKMESELDCTIDLAILRGTFEGWDKNKEFFFIDQDGKKVEFGKSTGSIRGAYGNMFYAKLYKNFPLQANRMMQYGRRNVSWSTVAPTGSVSILTATSSGIEPQFQPFYTRRKKVNPGEEGVRVDFTDQNGDTWQEFPVLEPKFKDWIQLNSVDLLALEGEVDFNLLDKYLLQKIFEKSPWYKSTANDIDWVKRVEIQGIIQKYVTHSISSTINLPEDVSLEAVSEIYMESWKKGLKGITVYRDGSRSGVLVSTNNNSNNKDIDSFNQHDAPKRPKELKCNIHTTVSKGVKWNVLVGLLEDKPYEVFAVPYFTQIEHGTLVKIKKGRYDLVTDKGETYSEDITSEMNSEQEAITRLTSTALRHGANIKFIVEQLNKSYGDITSFSKAISRVLKRYIPDGSKSTVSCNDCGSSNVIFEEGCNKCLDCGSSACS